MNSSEIIFVIATSFGPREDRKRFINYLSLSKVNFKLVVRVLPVFSRNKTIYTLSSEFCSFRKT